MNLNINISIESGTLVPANNPSVLSIIQACNGLHDDSQISDISLSKQSETQFTLDTTGSGRAWSMALTYDPLNPTRPLFLITSSGQWTTGEISAIHSIVAPLMTLVSSVSYGLVSFSINWN